MKIYFMRHGETEWNRLEKIQGRIDNPLNEKGKKQARVATEIFADVPITHVYASTLSRAIETAKIVVSQKLEPIQDARIIERDFGVLEGQNHEAYYVYAHSDEMPDSVERNDAIYDRVMSFFQDLIVKQDEADVILVVAHAHTIRVWTERMFPTQFSFHSRLYNCQAVEIEYKDGVFHFGGLTKKVEVMEDK